MEGGGSDGGMGSLPGLIIACVHLHSWAVVFICRQLHLFVGSHVRSWAFAFICVHLCVSVFIREHPLAWVIAFIGGWSCHWWGGTAVGSWWVVMVGSCCHLWWYSHMVAWLCEGSGYQDIPYSTDPSFARHGSHTQVMLCLVTFVMHLFYIHLLCFHLHIRASSSQLFIKFNEGIE